MAPILSFTAEEIWRYMPGNRGASALLEIWYDIPADTAAELAGDDYWDQVLAVRTEVARELEKARVAGAIGASLEAEVDLYVDANLRNLLGRLEDELRFVFITSDARLHDLNAEPKTGVDTGIPGLRVQVNPSPHAKCERCWHRRPDVGRDPAHPALCGRCVNNVAGRGEERQYA
jgi:isoleucyl-tRNA synthetase